MRYWVTVGERELEVELDGDRVTVDGQPFSAHVSAIEGTPLSLVTIGDEVHRVLARRGDARGRYALWLAGFRHEVDAVDERTRAIRSLAGAASGPAGPAPLKAPMPGMIVRVAVAVGDTVCEGQSLIVMEAMKMENELRATVAGTVKAVHARAGAAVEKGALLLELE
ncbi:MAG: biotin/lipoyl-binding protein [Gemmatimonadaceae bacterium]|nr:biotin/lipoyl-binding protein [Gemmatimonadaceae bacterium]